MSANLRAKPGLKAYGTTQFNGNTAREQEAQALSHVVSMLERSMNEPENTKQYYDAIAHNQKLWTAINLSMFDPDHEVPERIKNNLLRLGLFMSKHSKKLLAEYEPDKLKVMIDINRSLALGLQGITPDQKRAF